METLILFIQGFLLIAYGTLWVTAIGAAIKIAWIILRWAFVRHGAFIRDSFLIGLVSSVLAILFVQKLFSCGYTF